MNRRYLVWLAIIIVAVIILFQLNSCRGETATPIAEATPTFERTREATAPAATVMVAPPAIVTPAPPVTETPGIPPATVTPPPGSDHDTTTWHPPGVEFHHHGADPMSSHPAIVEWLQDHPEYAAIGGIHETSDIENVFPFSPGKHEGNIGLAETDTNCDLGEQESNDSCILAYYYQLHMLGTGHEARTRVHSWKGVFYICDRATRTQCGIVAARGHVDWGLLHTTYKRVTCNIESNPPYDDKYKAEQDGQPPYTAIAGSDGSYIFQSSLTNPVILPFFDPDPNRLLEVALSSLAWSSPNADPELCVHHEHDRVFCPDGACIHNHTRFQVFTMKLVIGGYPRPYQGFIDNQGADAPQCKEEGPDCYTLYIGAGVPAGDAFLNRVVRHGDASYAPILNYDDGSELHMPGH